VVEDSRQVRGWVFYLALTWYGPTEPPAFAIRPPDGFWMSHWFKTLDRKGIEVLEASLEFDQ
jgi:hypothetical protein